VKILCPKGAQFEEIASHSGLEIEGGFWHRLDLDFVRMIYAKNTISKPRMPQKVCDWPAKRIGKPIMEPEPKLPGCWDLTT
jgi:hypothetical protein